MGVEFFDNTDKFLRENKVDISRALSESGKYGLSQIKGETPELTGHLLVSNHIEVTDNDVLFINDADYAAYVEFGTMFKAANPFMRRGLTKSQIFFERIFKQNLKA